MALIHISSWIMVNIIFIIIFVLIAFGYWTGLPQASKIELMTPLRLIYQHLLNWMLLHKHTYRSTGIIRYCYRRVESIIHCPEYSYHLFKNKLLYLSVESIILRSVNDSSGILLVMSKLCFNGISLNDYKAGRYLHVSYLIWFFFLVVVANDCYIFFKNRKLQEDLTDEMVGLAQQLKESSLMMSRSLEDTEKVSYTLWSLLLFLILSVYL